MRFPLTPVCVAVTLLWTATGTEPRVRPILARNLPHLNGAAAKATLIEVNYGPGESSPTHTHPCAVMGYVVEGAVRMQVDSGPETIYRKGDGFYEAPNGVHAISANASRTERAKFVAYFVCDHEAPLSADLPQHSGDRP
ncbi:cupin domain-containing protein [uncultured Paludibaculum sp.]|uniref:cupin domain-containing protein n=1 Tax=uncultured Paludibaculum sp. TaxID=1765020 RepID=UPI002AAB8966|nr:cupin domain-containing protein [uncultured Paludibaculum sp.]